MTLRQPIVVVLGHVDHGKCVAPDTLIQLANGRTMTARDVFEEYSRESRYRRISDGWIARPRDPLEIFSFDGKKIIRRRVSLLWKLFAPASMIRLRLASGDQIAVTREHPFLVVDSALRLTFRNADRLKSGDFLVVPERFGVGSDVREVKRRIVLMLARKADFLVYLDEKIAARFLRRLRPHSLEALRKKGLFTTDPYSCLRNLRFRAADLVALGTDFGLKAHEIYDMIAAVKNSRELQRCGHTSNLMSLPKTREGFEKLGYVLGCMAGDGYIPEGVLDNNDSDIQTSYRTSVGSSLGLQTTMIRSKSGWRIRTNGGRTFERFLMDIVGFPRLDKSRTVEMPPIVQMYEPMFRSFVAGWFDTDGYVSPVNHSIEITTKSEKLARQVALRLLNDGILSTVSVKYGYFTLRVANRPYLGRFLRRFNPRCLRKKARIQSSERASSTSRIFGITPVPGKVLSHFDRRDSNLAIPYFTRYTHYPRLSRPFLEKFSREFGRGSDRFSERLRTFLRAGLTCTEVVGTQTVINGCDFVYDFTVPRTRNYLAERVIAHNTTLLDKLRGTTVAKREPGQITQWIGASLLPSQTIEEICGDLLQQFHFELKVPGLLFIDTPGHETFSNLRRRGGSAADIAILVVDVTKGIEPQTVESINILKSRKTPFIVAANKIDAITGWKSEPESSFMTSLKSQFPEIQTDLDNRVYTIIGTLSRLGFRAERYDRISDFTQTVAIVPVSAKTGEGIPELLAILTGLTQAYLSNKLQFTSGPARGTVLEVKDEPGLGTTVNAIIYDGSLKVDDTIVLGGRDKPIITEVRAILLPKPLDEIRDPKDRFTSVKRVTAASGVKVAAPALETALAGSPLYAVPKGKNAKEYVRIVEDEVEKLRIKTERSGIVLKTDTLGSLEAVTESLSRHDVQIRLADIGDVSKRDVVEAEAASEEDRLLAVVLAFNVKVLPDAQEEAKAARIPIFQSDIIYHMIEDYLRWNEEQRTAGVKAELDVLVRPCKAKVLPGFIFRRSKPAIVGVEILSGRLKPKFPIIASSGKKLGDVQRIQDKGNDIQEAVVGMQVAVSIEDGVVGRNISEGDSLYSDVPERHLKTLMTKFPSELSESDQETIKELIQLKRRENPVWGL